MDATDHGHNEDHKPGLLSCEEGIHVALVAQVKLGMGVQDKASEAQVAERNGQANQAPIAGDEDIR